jgi:flagellar biosynthetic protein FliR
VAGGKGACQPPGGRRAGSLYDPASGTSSTELGRLWFLAALLFFFQLNGHHWLVAGLARSYTLCPVGSLVYRPAVTMVAVELLAAQFSLAVRLAAPAIAALILADVALGLAGRGMPQMNLLMVGMPAKILMGLTALALCSPILAPVLGQVLEILEAQLTHLLQALA